MEFPAALLTCDGLLLAQVNMLISAAIPLGHMSRRWDIAVACLFLARLAAGCGG